MKNGGPAFPQSLACTPSGDVVPSWERGPDCEGMSLRDWFASQETSLPVEIVDGDMSDDERIRRACEWRYRCADAMLAEREKAG